MSRIANSKLGKVGALTIGAGSLLVPTYEMLNPPAAHAVIISDPEGEFEDPDHFFSKYDPNKTGRVTLGQYLKIKMDYQTKILKNIGIIPNTDTYRAGGILEKRAREAFDTYDKNPKDGVITPEELRK